MESEKEIQKTENPANNAAGKQEEIKEEELLSYKALEDDLELDEKLENLPI